MHVSRHVAFVNRLWSWEKLIRIRRNFLYGILKPYTWFTYSSFLYICFGRTSPKSLPEELIFVLHWIEVFLALRKLQKFMKTTLWEQMTVLVCTEYQSIFLYHLIISRSTKTFESTVWYVTEHKKEFFDNISISYILLHFYLKTIL